MDWSGGHSPSTTKFEGSKATEELWTDCTTEQECKYFIQAVISEKGISVGDFTKAMMKIVTIAKELENLCEMLEQVELMYKLRQIEGLVLKYVLTSQSLYV